MVIPRSRSMSMESSTCSTISRSVSPPVAWINRSASVDLPWSICAMIAKLRMFSMAAFMARGLAPVFGSGNRWAWRFLATCLSPQSGEARSFRGRHLPFRQEWLKRDRLAVARHDRVARRHWLPMRAVGVERLGHHHHVAAGLAVIERVGVVVGGVAEGVEIAPVGERRREAQRLPVAVAADHLGQRPKDTRASADRILVAAGAEDGEEDRFRIGCADARA